MLNYVHAAFRWVENYSDHHQHTISLIESISTTAAVIIALRSGAQNRRDQKPQLEASISIHRIVYPGQGKETFGPQYIGVTIQNIGVVPVKIKSNFFSWYSPFSKNYALVWPIDEGGDSHVSRRSYPFMLPPNTTETILLTPLASFHENLLKYRARQICGYPKNFSRCRAYILADGGGKFRAKIGRDVIKELAKVRLVSTKNQDDSKF